jgi:hypothetical protein
MFRASFDEQDMRESLRREAGSSNRILSDREMRLTRQLLHDTEEQLLYLDLQIGDNDSSSSYIIANDTRARLFDDIERFRVAIAPQKRLPPEMLAQIFSLSLGDNPTTLPPKLNNPPWIFGHVCSRWRAVALDEPRLWNSLHVLGRRPQGLRVSVPLPALEICLRARQAPLSLTFEGPTNPNSIIIPLSKQVRYLEIHDAEPSLMTSDPPFDLLESAVLNFPSFTDELWHTALNSDITAFSNAPKLRSVNFRVNDTHSVAFGSKSNLHLPWAQLTSLTFFHVTPPLISTLEILREAVSLVDFELILGNGQFIAHVDFIQLNALPPIIHPNLRTVRLGLREETELGLFLKPLVLPALRSFKNSGTRRTTLVHPGFYTFIKQSCHSLKFFSFSTPGLTPNMEEILRGMPNLVELDLHRGSRVPPSILKMMGSGELLPVLEMLGCETFSLRAFVAFLESRPAGPMYRGLRKARIVVIKGWFNVEDVRAGQERYNIIRPSMEREGRHINIRYIRAHDGHEPEDYDIIGI